MLLENLPNELLFMVLKNVPPEDRLLIRQTSRTFFSIVDSVGILPLPPCTGAIAYKINVDFIRKVLVVSTINEDGKVVAYEVAEPTKEDYTLSCESENCIVLKQHVSESSTIPQQITIQQQMHCMQLDNWHHFLDQYLRRFSRSKEQGKDVLLDVRLDGEDRTPTLRLLSTEIKQLNISAPQRLFGQTWLNETQLNLLHNWKRSVVSEVTTALHHNLELTPSQLDNVTVPVLSCFLNDDAAVNILKKFRDRTLPPLRHWSFKHLRVGEWKKFTEELELNWLPLDDLVNLLEGDVLLGGGPYRLKIRCRNFTKSLSLKFFDFHLTIQPYPE